MELLKTFFILPLYTYCFINNTYLNGIIENLFSFLYVYIVLLITDIP